MDQVVPKRGPLLFCDLWPELQLLRMRTRTWLDMGRYTFGP
jgi:hypothetical protein